MLHAKINVFIIVVGLLGFGLVQAKEPLPADPLTEPLLPPGEQLIEKAVLAQEQQARQQFEAAIRQFSTLLSEKNTLVKQRTAQAAALATDLRALKSLSPESTEYKALDKKMRATVQKIASIKEAIAAKQVEMSNASQQKGMLSENFVESRAANTYLKNLFDQYEAQQKAIRTLQDNEGALVAAVNKIRGQLREVIGKNQDFVMIGNANYKISALLENPELLKSYPTLEKSILSYQAELHLLPSYERIKITAEKQVGFLKKHFGTDPTEGEQLQITNAENAYTVAEDRYKSALSMKGELEQEIRTKTLASTIHALSEQQATAVQALQENREQQTQSTLENKAVEDQVTFIASIQAKLDKISPLTETSYMKAHPGAILSGSDEGILESYDTFRAEFIQLVEQYMAQKVLTDSTNAKIVSGEFKTSEFDNQLVLIEASIEQFKVNLANPPNKDTWFITFQKWLKKIFNGSSVISHEASQAIRTDANTMLSNSQDMLNILNENSQNTKLQAAKLNAQAAVDSLSRMASYDLNNINQTKESAWLKELVKKTGVQLKDPDAVSRLIKALNAQKTQLTADDDYFLRLADLQDLSREQYDAALILQTDKISEALEKNQAITLQGDLSNKTLSQLVANIKAYNELITAEGHTINVKPTPIIPTLDPIVNPDVPIVIPDVPIVIPDEPHPFNPPE